jgi:hypothetical protein
MLLLLRQLHIQQLYVNILLNPFTQEEPTWLRCNARIAGRISPFNIPRWPSGESIVTRRAYPINRVIKTVVALRRHAKYAAKNSRCGLLPQTRKCAAFSAEAAFERRQSEPHFRNGSVLSAEKSFLLQKAGNDSVNTQEPALAVSVLENVAISQNNQMGCGVEN